MRVRRKIQIKSFFYMQGGEEYPWCAFFIATLWRFASYIHRHVHVFICSVLMHTQYITHYKSIIKPTAMTRWSFICERSTISTHKNIGKSIVGGRKWLIYAMQPEIANIVHVNAKSQQCNNWEKKFSFIIIVFPFTQVQSISHI